MGHGDWRASPNQAAVRGRCAPRHPGWMCPRAQLHGPPRTPDRSLRVYSVHLGTPAEVMPQARVDQALAIAEDARRGPEAVIVAGDFNNRDLVGRVFENAGFAWLSLDLGRTLRFFCWDHVFTRGLSPPIPSSRGIVADNNGASDHLPVWAELRASGPGTGARALLPSTRN
jgi:endonuclease/exonuclease/phosphatase family metal-dependent hydrolase